MCQTPPRVVSGKRCWPLSLSVSLFLSLSLSVRACVCCVCLSAVLRVQLSVTPDHQLLDVVVQNLAAEALEVARDHPTDIAEA